MLFKILLIQGNKCTLQSPCHLDEFLWVVRFFFGLLTWYCLERMNKLYLEVSIDQHTVLWLSTGPLSLQKTFLLLIGRRETPTQPSYFFFPIYLLHSFPQSTQPPLSSRSRSVEVTPCMCHDDLQCFPCLLSSGYNLAGRQQEPVASCVPELKGEGVLNALIVGPVDGSSTCLILVRKEQNFAHSASRGCFMVGHEEGGFQFHWEENNLRYLQMVVMMLPYL